MGPAERGPGSAQCGPRGLCTRMFSQNSLETRREVSGSVTPTARGRGTRGAAVPVVLALHVDTSQGEGHRSALRPVSPEVEPVPQGHPACRGHGGRCWGGPVALDWVGGRPCPPPPPP